jgi:hypothetical protein
MSGEWSLRFRSASGIAAGFCRRSIRVGAVFCALLALLVLAPSAFAQGRARFQGLISDPTGSAVPAVTSAS